MWSTTSSSSSCEERSARNASCTSSSQSQRPCPPHASPDLRAQTRLSLPQVLRARKRVRTVLSSPPSEVPVLTNHAQPARCKVIHVQLHALRNTNNPQHHHRSLHAHLLSCAVGHPHCRARHDARSALHDRVRRVPPRRRPPRSVVLPPRAARYTLTTYYMRRG